MSAQSLFLLSEAAAFLHSANAVIVGRLAEAHLKHQIDHSCAHGHENVPASLQKECVDGVRLELTRIHNRAKELEKKLSESSLPQFFNTEKTLTLAQLQSLCSSIEELACYPEIQCPEVPAPDGGNKPDGGPSTTDGGPSTTDGGPSTTDGGPSTTDGGPSTTDGGPSTTDGGPSTTDGGSACQI